MVDDEKTGRRSLTCLKYLTMVLTRYAKHGTDHSTFYNCTFVSRWSFMVILLDALPANEVQRRTIPISGKRCFRARPGGYSILQRRGPQGKHSKPLTHHSRMVAGLRLMTSFRRAPSARRQCKSCRRADPDRFIDFRDRTLSSQAVEGLVSLKADRPLQRTTPSASNVQPLVRCSCRKVLSLSTSAGESVDE